MLNYKELKSDLRKRETGFKNKVMEVVSSYQPIIEQLSNQLSILDLLCAFATVAHNSTEPYSKPTFLPSNTQKSTNENHFKHLIIKDSRHILLDNNECLKSAATVKNSNPNNNHTSERVIANDCIMEKDSTVQIITGINMGGKSTYLKQVGICVFLAHIGCFVPCSEMQTPLISNIISRVGADDNSHRKMSTFMCEMMEVSNMLQNIGKSSLLLIDELGRGTSTDDGIGLSYAILEQIATNEDCYCLCATHFSELNIMEKKIKNIKNKHVDCEISKGIIKMTYKIKDGSTDKSYGVNLLKSMSFPNEIIIKAEDFLKEEIEILENIDI